MVIKNIEQSGNQLLLTVNIPEVQEEDLGIHLSVDAIGSRMVLYNLKTSQEAIEAIVREHARRMIPDLSTPSSREELIEVHPEDANSIPVNIECQKLLEDTLEENLDRIRYAIVERMPESDA